jgi:hypothetical protein
MIRFTTDLDTTNHALAPGEQAETALNVEVLPLDHILAGQSPLFMKIDVEGYETEVLKGAHETLAKSSLKVVLMELNGSGGRYGWDEAFNLKLMRELGFATYSYFPFERKLRALAGGKTKTSSGNTIFIRDEDFVRERLEPSPTVIVHGHDF